MKFLTYFALFAITPLFASAQGDFDSAGTLIAGVVSFMNDVLVPFVFALAFLVFIWGIFTYFILGGSDEGKRDSGKQLMLWGIIGFVLMVSVWGIVNLLSSGIGLTEGDGDNIGIPSLPTEAPRN